MNWVYFFYCPVPATYNMCMRGVVQGQTVWYDLLVALRKIWGNQFVLYCVLSLVRYGIQSVNLLPLGA